MVEIKKHSQTVVSCLPPPPPSPRLPPNPQPQSNPAAIAAHRLPRPPPSFYPTPQIHSCSHTHGWMDGWMGRPRTRAVPATVDGAGSAPIPTAAASAMEMEAGPLSHQRRPKARWICTQMRDGIHPLISGGAASADAGTSPTSPTTTAGITMACSARVVGFLLSAMPR